MKTTGWYSSDQKPVHKGVYQRLFEDHLFWSRWDGMKWRELSGIFQIAEASPRETSYPKLTWRGVAK